MNTKQTVLQMKYARIIQIFAQKAGLSYEQAMDIFYNSQTFCLLEKGVADIHCRSDFYIADELWQEYQETNQEG